ncbi:hypothetical protein E2L08_16455 [Palleronia sediminis]|uniref:Uncharacterized protein n=2 Tax=Palleronia sediminis TaxID=2547833 RepID=A0A4R5ZVM6_9RHOB|nr:hypothetical protein E2L08_16455 [Palleronia sediminis]
MDVRAEELRAIDDMIFGDAAGVAQASDQLREALDAIRTALNERRFGDAARARSNTATPVSQSCASVGNA